MNNDCQNPEGIFHTLYRDTKGPAFRDSWKKAKDKRAESNPYAFRPVLAATLITILAVGLMAVLNKNETAPEPAMTTVDETIDEWQPYTDFLLAENTWGYPTDFLLYLYDNSTLISIPDLGSSLLEGIEDVDNTGDQI